MEPEYEKLTYASPYYNNDQDKSITLLINKELNSFIEQTVFVRF